MLLKVMPTEFPNKPKTIAEAAECLIQNLSDLEIETLRASIKITPQEISELLEAEFRSFDWSPDSSVEKKRGI